MNSILLGSTEIIPSGIFSDHISHNRGKNHETYIEYPDMREIKLPLEGNQIIIESDTSPRLPYGTFGTWEWVGYHERKQILCEMKRKH
jgi:hypothetical protein